MEIKRLYIASDEMIALIHNLLLNAYSHEIKKYLIYAEPTYPAYLRTLINESDDNLFYIALVNNSVKGFAHFKIIDNNIIHLNNIAISKEDRGHGTGSLLLEFSVNDLKSKNLDKLTLDVFSSNTIAFEWYKKLGMVVVSASHWYEISSLLENKDVEVSEKRNYVISNDENGFSGIYIDNIKIASIINNSILLFRDASKFFAHLPTIAFLKRTYCYKLTLITESTYDFDLIEKSYRLSIELSNLFA